jgi:DNA-directed RNA polymerase specialized sigma24 family protein
LTGETPREALERLFRADRARMLAALIRVLGDFELAQDALSDALAVALPRWERDGVPDDPLAWTVTVARRLAVDRIRRAEVGRAKYAQLAEGPATVHNESAGLERVGTTGWRCCSPAAVHLLPPGAGRADAAGELVLDQDQDQDQDQDRGRWDQAQITEGLALVRTALRGATPASTSCRPLSRRYTAKPHTRPGPTGRRSLRCTPSCTAGHRHRWSRSTTPSHWPWCTAQQRGCGVWRRSPNWRTTGSGTRRGATCCAGSAG